jgi:2-methylcitrate dehydratase PrpD
MSLTKTLGQFVSGLSPDRLPAEAKRVAKIGFIDCIGTMIAGRDEQAPQILKTVLKPTAGKATLYFSGQTSPAPEAAWINGTAAHALDFDDVAMRGHPSTVLVPAIIAESEDLDASGAAMLVAYVAGYETWAELVRRDKGFHHSKGWHPTGIFGVIAAAAACASLRGLDAEHAAQALSLGASQSAGLMANFGTMTKPFHAGRAAHAGIMAARLAGAGFTSSMDGLEHPQGFLNAVSPAGEVDRGEAPPTLGKEFQIEKLGLSIKKYPTCYCTHRAIDGMLDLVASNKVRPDDVSEVTVTLSENYATILRNHTPQTGLAAKFSIEFAMSCAIVAHRVGLTELTDAFVQRGDVQSLIGRVSIETNKNYDQESSGASVQDQVSIRLASGETLNGEPVKHARGHAERPLSEAELFTKFENCLDVGKSRVPASVLFERLKGLEHGSARQMTAA